MLCSFGPVASRPGRGGDVVEATLAGYKRLLRWAALPGEPAFAVEGCGSYGAGLARFLETSEQLVWECERPHRGDRKRGKSDLIACVTRALPVGGVAAAWSGLLACLAMVVGAEQFRNLWAGRFGVVGR